MKGLLLKDAYQIWHYAKGVIVAAVVMMLSLIHISEPTRRTPISYAVFCLKKKKTDSKTHLRARYSKIYDSKHK